MSIQKNAVKEFHLLLDEVIQLQSKRKEFNDKAEQLDTKSREKFVQAVGVMRETGVGDYEISELTREYLRNKIPKTSLNRYLSELKPETEESTSQSEPNSELGQNDNNNDTEEESTFEEPEPMVVTTGGEEEKVEQKLESVGVDLKQQRIDELEAALRKSEEQKEQFKRDSLARGEALKKSSFKVASDPENMNEDYDEKIALPMLLSKIRQKQASGWHFVENRMRYIS